MSGSLRIGDEGKIFIYIPGLSYLSIHPLNPLSIMGDLIVLDAKLRNKAEALIKELRLEDERICVARGLPFLSYVFPRYFRGRIQRIRFRNIFMKYFSFNMTVYLLAFPVKMIFSLPATYSMIAVGAFFPAVLSLILAYPEYSRNKRLLRGYDYDWYIVTDWRGSFLDHELAHIKLHNEIMMNTELGWCITAAMEEETDNYISNKKGKTLTWLLSTILVKITLAWCTVLRRLRLIN